MNYIPTGIFLVLILSPLALSCTSSALKRTSLVLIGNSSFIAEIADTQEKRIWGLSGRQDLLDGHGMLFLFDEEEVQNFWMKDMRFPLDLAFINEDEVIVDIHRNLPPCKGQDCKVYGSIAPAKYVLEVKAGGLQAVAIKSRVIIS